MSLKNIIKEKLLGNMTSSDSFNIPKNTENNIRIKHVAPIVYNVTSYYEIETIANNLFNNQSIIINLSNLELKDKYRVIDFLSGVCYSLKGKRTKLEDNIYIFTVEDF
ncbi:MAG: cell division protein SepF [Erysipelotrichaceae bacterium]|nr:cell division protein SepF [Erysipelotrichaceae bacterium]